MQLKKLICFFVSLAVISAVSTFAFLQYNSVLKLFYPMEYDDLIITYSSEYALDPYLVSAIINVESSYNTYAKSHKNARGLMQVTTSTGKWASSQIGIKDYNDDSLFNPVLNIRIGCWYLNNLRREFSLSDMESDTVLLLAAYNGGSGNVKKWLNNSEYSETGTTLDQIPFKETEDYVEKVFKSYKMYKKLYPDIFSQ